MSWLSRNKLLLGAAAVTVGLGVAGYVGHDLTAAPTATQAAAPAAIPVDTVVVEKHPVRLWQVAQTC